MLRRSFFYQDVPFSFFLPPLAISTSLKDIKKFNSRVGACLQTYHLNFSLSPPIEAARLLGLLFSRLLLSMPTRRRCMIRERFQQDHIAVCDTLWKVYRKNCYTDHECFWMCVSCDCFQPKPSHHLA